MRAAIYGAGAMGTVLGALIVNNGGKVDLITRNREHINALNKAGAKISGGLNFTVNVNAYPPEDMTGEYDVIFLMTKQRENAAALEILNEVFAAARANGVKLAKIQGHDIVKLFGYRNKLKRAISFKLLPLAMKNHRDLVSGMYYDLSAGKRCEADFICGAALSFAKAGGVAVPVLERAVRLVREIERGERKICPENINDLI